MDIIKLTPAIVSLLLLSAHFYRAGWVFLVVYYLSLVGLLFVRRAWVARLVQISLVIGSVEWVRTLVGYVAVRQTSGQLWVRLVVILGTVALIAALSALVFQLRALKIRYKIETNRKDLSM